MGGARGVEGGDERDGGGAEAGVHPLRIHLDTDFAGDPDDACALAMLLGWEGVELAGITTCTDPGGQRAGYVHELLGLARGRAATVPVAAGAEVGLTTRRPAGEIPDPQRYWGLAAAPAARPARPGTAVDLLAASIEAGATIVAIGPFTNLALLEVCRPGLLASVPVVVMGGFTRRPPDGFPDWGPALDWNVQSDVLAADVVYRSCGDLTVVGVDVTVQVHLRARDLDRLRAAGPLGAVLARSSQAHGEEYGMPDDLVNYHHDPLACAVAAGWDGGTIESQTLEPVIDGDGHLRLSPSAGGRAMRVVTGVDAEAFSETWLASVERASR